MAMGYAIAVLLCAGANCEMVPVEPGISYPTETECAAALASRGKALGDAAAERRQGTRRVETMCLQAAQAVTEVEDRYDVLETVIAHPGPSVDSGYVGVVEGGQRILVTGLVNGTNWVRVLLADGSSGFVYADHLRKVGAPSPPLQARVASSPAPAPAAPLPPKRELATAVAPATAVPPAAAPVTAVPSAAIPAKREDAEFQDCPTCPVMVRIPAGSFAMGSNLDPSERPIRRVSVPAFALGKYMVTVADWAACVAAGGCAYKPAQTDEHPERRAVTNLSWDDATQYAQWLRQTTGKPYRLPSEAEWEYAARAGTATRYSWGEQPGAGQADCDGCGAPHNPRSPADVSAYPTNPWGLAGMQGGVAEWVEDCWHPSFQGAPVDGSPWHGANCSQRLLRGGSWKNPPSGVTVSARNFYDASVRYLANGLRVALTLPGREP